MSSSSSLQGEAHCSHPGRVPPWLLPMARGRVPLMGQPAAHLQWHWFPCSGTQPWCHPSVPPTPTAKPLHLGRASPPFHQCIWKETVPLSRNFPDFHRVGNNRSLCLPLISWLGIKRREGGGEDPSSTKGSLEGLGEGRAECGEGTSRAHPRYIPPGPPRPHRCPHSPIAHPQWHCGASPRGGRRPITHHPDPTRTTRAPQSSVKFLK